MTAKDTKDGPSSATLKLSLKDLGAFSLGLTHLAEMVPERTTASQLLFFLYAGLGDIRGVPMTFNDIKDIVGDSLGRSLHTTYRVFLDGNRSVDKTRAKGLQWLRTEIDPSDNRRKYLHLTDEGRRAMRELFEQIKA